MSERSEDGKTVAETELLLAVDEIAKLAKGQIVGKLPGNNEPKGKWANGQEPDEVTDEESDVSDDSGEDERKGKKSDTDYKPRSVRKAVGQDHDGAGGAEDDGADDDDPDEDEDEDEEDEDGEDEPDDEPGDGDTRKSFAARARRSRRIHKGVEVSPFLRALVTTLGKSLQTLERQLRNDIGRQIAKAEKHDRSFKKSIADVLSGLSAVALEQGDLLKAMSAQPARGPKSQLHAARPIQKSFDGGAGDEQVTLPDGSTVPQLDKSVVMQRLLTGAAKGLIQPTDVVKFETTGIVAPALYKALATDAQFAK